MLNFERSSLSQKLTAMSVFCSGAALLIVYLSFAVTFVVAGRAEQTRQLHALAGVIGAAGLADPGKAGRRQAERTLAALDGATDLTLAALFDADGKLVASIGAGDELEQQWQAEQARAAQPQLALGALFSTRLRLLVPLAPERGQAGSVLLEADLARMWQGVARSLLIITVAGVCALLLALLLAARFRNGIVEPLGKLIAAAHKVSTSQNFSLRISHQRHDELGQLIDAFNTMLSQIEGRGAALANHRDELERQVSVRTEQLEKAKDAAEAASRAKSAFLATMSHEIRTPMNGVLGMTDMLLGTTLSEKQRNYTSMVKRSGEHLLVIINDILDFSKIEAGKLSIEYILFNLCDLLDDIDHAFAPQAQAKGIALAFELGADIPLAIYGDPNRLRQILANLLGNAIKFTESGQISVKVGVTSENDQAVGLRFEVQDTGIGVSREASGRIFEAFSQADGSTTRKYGGTGLGLAISKQLVELMDGKIGLTNAQPRGSLFWFALTFDKRRVGDDEPAAAARAAAGMRVLIVDQCAAGSAALQRQLGAWHIDCDVAASATDAIDQLHAAVRAARPYSVALIDMELERTSGLALAAAIKADSVTAPTRMLLLSTLRNACDPVQRRSAGVAFQLIKPVRDGDLYECLCAPARAGETRPGAPAPAPVAAAPAARTRRRKVLLAEDNPVNVEVATAMLDSLGLEVVCARHGEEALRATRATVFDAVLMDCQMPVMDGFAATAEIRRDEQRRGRGRVLPIIAITANALQGDREACLSAGMDDYLSKPFSQQDLAKVIGRWIKLPLQPQCEPEPLASEPNDAINRHALDNIRALSKDSGDALVHKVIMAYVDDTPLQLQTLRSAIAGLDPSRLRKVAHSLKSASANVGADSLAQMCREMERLGRTETTEGASSILRDMEHEFQAVRDSLSALLEKET